MDGFEVTGPYASAMLMSVGALCVFIWGVLSGALHNSDDAAKRFFETEMESDRDHAKASRRARTPICMRWRNMLAGPFNLDMATCRCGCWWSMPCCSSGDSTMPIIIGVGLGRGGSPDER